MNERGYRGAFLILLLCLVAIMGGCWGRSFFRMPSATLDTSAKVDSLLEENAMLRARISSIEQTLAKDQEFARGSNAQLKMDLEELKDQLNALQEMLRDAQERTPYRPAERRKAASPDTVIAPPPPLSAGEGEETAAGDSGLDSLAAAARGGPRDTVSAGTGGIDTAGALAAPAPPPEEVYRQIYLAYNKRSYEIALEEGTAFLEEYPDDPLAEEVLFIRGESLMELANQIDALKEFSTLIQRFPRGSRAPGALLRMAICYDQMGQTELAAGVVRRLMKDFPRSEEASVAEERFGGILAE